MMTPSPDPFQAIADSSRRHILQLLMQDTHTINSLAENFDMSRPAVSKHVKILQIAGFIAIEDKGRERYCTLSEDGFNELRGWIDHFDNFWAGKMNNLGTMLKGKKIK